MILDTSVLVAIVRHEPDASQLLESISRADVRRVSTATYVETSIVIDSGHDPMASRRLDDLLREWAVVLEPVTSLHAEMARAAYRDFGRGSSHPARLNFGDVFAYALAKSLGEPLLFKGEDFNKTDVEVV